MRRALLPLIVLAIAAAGGAWWWQNRANGPPGWQGYVDADYVRVSPTLGGQLVTLAVRRGQQVAAGAPLFSQDDTNDCAAQAQAAAELTEARNRLLNLEKAGRETEITQAKADLADMIATRDMIAQDLARNRALLRSGAATQQTVDQQSAQLASASAHVDAAQAKLRQMQDPTGREYEIAAQQAAVTAQKAALAQADWRLAQRHVTAPMAAEVADTYAVPGEMIDAGTPVVELLPPGNILVRFFVPETALARIHMGERLAIGCDNCGPALPAQVTFIAPQPQYTPPVIYSEQTRDKLVYMIEAHPDLAQATKLKPGQPVTVQAVP